MITWRTMINGKCPRCGKSPIFRGWIEVHERCLHCGLRFDRGESGYFLGAMYLEYGIAGAFIGGTTLLIRLGSGLALMPSLAIAAAIFLPLVPLTIRLSRLLWISVDHRLDPTKKE